MQVKSCCLLSIDSCTDALGSGVQADLWSLGIILFELFASKPPFFTNNVYTLIKQIINNRITYPLGMSSEFRSFLEVTICCPKAQRGCCSCTLTCTSCTEDCSSTALYTPSTTTLQQAWLCCKPAQVCQEARSPLNPNDTS